MKKSHYEPVSLSRRLELRDAVRKATRDFHLGTLTVQAFAIVELLDALEELEHDLAECYRLSGADPNGNEDWRLARNAVSEVRKMRLELDTLNWIRSWVR